MSMYPLIYQKVQSSDSPLRATQLIHLVYFTIILSSLIYYQQEADMKQCDKIFSSSFMLQNSSCCDKFVYYLYKTVLKAAVH